MAMAGRSNVGKSSLINHLLNRRTLAKVSSTPGKTKLINFFAVDDRITLVDLPGYGYAKANKEKQEEWSRAIDTYLQKREPLKLIILLLDVRRLPSQEDLDFFNWTQHHKKQLLIVFTKTDKVNREERENNIKKALEFLHVDASLPYLHYSTKEIESRKKLAHQINGMLNRSLA
jgi:GTP-binding protein